MPDVGRAVDPGREVRSTDRGLQRLPGGGLRVITVIVIVVAGYLLFHLGALRLPTRELGG